MKRTLTTLALAGTMMLLAVPTALATHVDGTSQDAAGHGTLDCRPGANNHRVGSWELMTETDFIAEVLAVTGGVVPPERAAEIWEFCDKNRDGFACVMRQTFPEGSPYNVVWTLLDNRPFAPRAIHFTG